MNTELIQLEPTAELPSCSLRGLMCTTMRPAEASTYPGPCWWTWSQEPWAVSDPDLLVKSSDLTTLSLDSLELATTGPRVTTPKEPNWSTVLDVVRKEAESCDCLQGFQLTH